MNDKWEQERKNTLKKIGNVINAMRERAGISQEELAKYLNVNQSTVNRYEKGTREIPTSTLPLISGNCNFHPMLYFVDFQNPENSPDAKTIFNDVISDYFGYSNPQIRNYVNEHLTLCVPDYDRIIDSLEECSDFYVTSFLSSAYVMRESLKELNRSTYKENDFQICRVVLQVVTADVVDYDYIERLQSVGAQIVKKIFAKG